MLATLPTWRPLQEPSRFQPVQLSLNSNVLYDGRVLTVIGWGRTESGDKVRVAHVALRRLLRAMSCLTFKPLQSWKC